MNLDDDGGSDPYCEVALVDPKGVRRADPGDALHRRRDGSSGQVV